MVDVHVAGELWHGGGLGGLGRGVDRRIDR